MDNGYKSWVNQYSFFTSYLQIHQLFYIYTETLLKMEQIIMRRNMTPICIDKCQMLQRKLWTFNFTPFPLSTRIPYNILNVLFDSNCESFVHLVKAFMGTGILAMPQAFYHAGYASGIINTIILGVLCTYCLHTLVNAQYILCKRNRIPFLSYPISMKIALANGPNGLRFLSSFAV